MTPQELKNSILQLAIQGRLVEQRPEEDSAEELYRQIQAEKQRLIKEGKIKKEKLLPEITDDEKPFEIPESWNWVRFSSLIKLQSGQDLTPDKYNANQKGIPYITGASNIENNTVIINRWTEYGRSFAYKGDLLLTCKGTVGSMAILDEGQVHIARQIMAITPFFVEIKYIVIVLATLVAKLKAAAKSIIPGIGRDEVLFSTIPLPPLEEQKRIVAKIEELLPYIDRYEQAWGKLEDFNKRFPADMQKSILQWAIQGKLVEQRAEDGTAEELYRQLQAEKQRLIKAGKIKKGKPLPEIAEDEMPFEIPESWKWVRLGAISTKLTDGSHNPPPNSSSGYPVISAKNVKNGIVSLENIDRYTDEIGFQKENPRTDITNGDIVMGIIGGSIGNIGVYTHDKKVIAQRSIAIIKTPIEIAFIVALLKSPFVQNTLKASTAGSAQGGVYLGTLSNLVLPLPPLAEQKRIVAKLEELLPLCDRLKREPASRGNTAHPSAEDAAQVEL